MIQIADKHDCCGCTACQSACPRQCITMRPDKEGFLYPVVDAAACIDCGLCLKVCPHLNPADSVSPLDLWAAINVDTDERMASSSGGVFSLLARDVLSRGGAVAGAAFAPDWAVEHTIIRSLDELPRLQGSKYLQSRMGNTYAQVKNLLQQNCEVLFSGTPCQIAGLRKFLCKDHPCLLTIEVVCHGVPSPLAWKSYLKEYVGQPQYLLSVSFRSKSESWKKYNYEFSLKSGDTISQTFHDNPYSQAFLSNLDLRPSCHNCKARSGRSGADITLSDYWGVKHHHPEADDDRGTSCVLANTPRGLQAVEQLQSTDRLQAIPTRYDWILQGNPSLAHDTSEPSLRRPFMFLLRKCGFRTAHRFAFSHALPLRICRKIIHILTSR